MFLNEITTRDEMIEYIMQNTLDHTNNENAQNYVFVGGDNHFIVSSIVTLLTKFEIAYERSSDVDDAEMHDYACDAQTFEMYGDHVRIHAHITFDDDGGEITIA